MADTLFPDYAVLENGRNEAQAMRLAERLREVDLQTMVTSADRRMVVARLRKEGVANAMQLLLLTEEEVVGWYNVGPVFLSILSDMREEVLRNPTDVVARWHNQLRLFVLPDDLQKEAEPADFFGSFMETVVAEEEHPVPETDHKSASIVLFEECMVEAVKMLEKRCDFGAVVRAFFLEGLPVETIVKNYNLPSSVSLFRTLNKSFLDPLLKGYPVKGIQLSKSLLKQVRELKKTILYAPASAIDGLQHMLPLRFLYMLDMTLLQRTMAETVWGGDFIVRLGEVQQCRKTQHDLFSVLQWRVVSAKENVLRKAMKPKGKKVAPIHVKFLRELLLHHPWIEQDKRGYRLVSERLEYDVVRMARIVYDARTPMKTSEIYSFYERLYFERPQAVSITNVRVHFPQVHNPKRGVWEWN